MAGTMGAAPGRQAEGGRFQAMNGLRLLSATLIVVFHAASTQGGTGFADDASLGATFALLSLGVPVFFVLSGFLLYRPMVAHRLTGAPRKSMGRYAWHRFRRLAPAYWVVLVAAAVLGRAELGTGSQPWRILGFAQIYDQYTFYGGLVVAWSLCTEAAFYLYLPFHDLVMRASKGAPGKRLLDEWVACGVLVAVALGTKVWLFETQPEVGFGTLFHYFEAFAVGMALAVLSVAEANRRRPGALFSLIARIGGAPWIAAVLLVVGLGTYRFPSFPNPLTVPEGLARDLLKVVVATLLVLPVVVDRHARAPFARVLSAPILQRWGELSYGIFLIHLPLLEWIQDQINQPAELLPTLWLALVTLLAATTLAVPLYALVERPLQRLDPFRPRPGGREAGSTSSSGVVAATTLADGTGA